MKKIFMIVVAGCVLLSGCRGFDRAMTLPVGETVQGTEDAKTGGSKEGAGQDAKTGGSKGGDGQNTEASGAQQADKIYVHVCGAVAAPGVVALPEGSRACDALEAAGGFAENAAVDAVNLAKLLQDGEQLFFPDVDEAQEFRQQEQDEKSGLVDINTADAALLCTLPGIGESRAADIIAYREANGGFKSPEDIMKVPGIKEAAFAKIKDKIVTR